LDEIVTGPGSAGVGAGPEGVGEGAVAVGTTVLPLQPVDLDSTRIEEPPQVSQVVNDGDDDDDDDDDEGNEEMTNEMAAVYATINTEFLRFMPSETRQVVQARWYELSRSTGEGFGLVRGQTARRVHLS
jgi:hypothetical protein